MPRLGRVGNSNDARLATLLGAAAVGLGDAVDDAVRGATGLDLAASTALVAMLDFTPAGSVRRLSGVLGLTHSGAVRLVDRLVTAGLVSRGPGADARSVALSLTDAGHRVALAARSAREAALQEVVAALPAARRVELAGAAEALVAQLTALRLARREAGRAAAGGALCRLCDFQACGRPDGACPAQQVTGSLP